MHLNQAEISTAFTASAAEHSFSSVWGNEMQREDFLALAASVRKFSVYQADIEISARSARAMQLPEDEQVHGLPQVGVACPS